MDTSELAMTTAELMDRIDVDVDDKGEATLGAVAVIAEVGYTDASGDRVTAIYYRCSDTRRWIQAGLFQAAFRGVFSER